MSDARPHYCLAAGRFLGLRFSLSGYVREVFCPWCGLPVAERAPNHLYARRVRTAHYKGPVCAHGRPDVPCLHLYDSDEQAHYELLCGAIREFPAALLARRYGCAPAVVSWIRPCPQCRQAVASQREPLLRYELSQIGRALAAELKAADRAAQALREDLSSLHEAFRELRAMVEAAAPKDERRGFVYLIGHPRAVKIGWSDRHPAEPGGRLSTLQIASYEDLQLLGLIEAPFSLERELHRRFAAHWIRGEWFARTEEILDYFAEHGIRHEAQQ
jgi:hypothetical protein